MHNGMYKAVFLDWDDTVGDFNHAAYMALREIYRKYRLQHFFSTFDNYYTLYNAHNIDLWRAYSDGKVTKDFLRTDRFLYPIVQAVGGSPVLFESAKLQRLAQRISSDFLVLTTRYFALVPGAEDMVRYLAAKYTLTLISNGFVEVQYEKIRRSGLETLFAHIVLSEEVGIQKPNAGIFEHALALNGVQPSEAVMIGDSWFSDIEGAQRAGIDQIWIRRNPSQTLPEGQTATYIIDDYSAIRRIL